MTRRIVKPQPDENGVQFMPTAPSLDWEQYYKEHWKCFLWDTEEGERIHIDCPYGNVGDILWVKETTRQYYPVDGDGYMNMEKLIVEYVADGLEPLLLSDGDGGFELDKNGQEKCVPLTPSIFMKKEHCRIRLEITDVRVERLQDISEEDAMNEGAERGILRDGPNTEKGEFHLEHNIHADYRNGFKFIWMTINGKESWDSNPWVWVISFKKL